MLASVGTGLLRLWRPDDPRPLATVSIPGAEYPKEFRGDPIAAQTSIRSRVVFRPDGQELAIIDLVRDPTKVWFWDVRERRFARDPIAQGGIVRDVDRGFRSGSVQLWRLPALNAVRPPIPRCAR